MNYKKNTDGTDMLDENGNPIPEDVNVNVNDTISPEEVESIKKAKDALLAEVIELRKKNRELSDTKTPVNTQINDVNNTEEVVKKILHEEKMANVKLIKDKTFERFITENKEFHPENDKTGLKREALKNKLSRFNTDNISDPDEFYAVIKEAQLLLVGNDIQVNTSKVNNPYSSTPQTRITPGYVTEDKLSPKERKLVERGAATEEAILKLKEKNPSYLASLLANIHD